MSVESNVIDYIEAHIVDAKELMPEFEISNPVKEERPQIEPIHVDDFDELIDVFKESLFVTPTMIDTIAVMLATSACIGVGGKEMIWVYVMGPPSCGKSTLCEAMIPDHNHCYELDKLTGFLSGFKQGKSKKDFSLLKDVQGKTVITKDYTSVLSLPEATQQNINGELRAISDRSINAKWRNGQQVTESNICFHYVAGVTDAILYGKDTGLGERWLMVDMTDTHHGSQSHVKSALGSIAESMLSSFPQRPEVEDESNENEVIVPPDRMLKIKRSTVGFLNYVHKRFKHRKPPIIPEWFMEYTTSIGRFVGKIRGQVKRDARTKDLLYAPRAEIGTRLAAQLLKLSLGLAIIFDVDELDEKIMNIIRRVACDTAKGYNFEIIKQLATNHDDGGLGLDKNVLSKRLKISTTDVVRRLSDLKVLGLIDNDIHVPNNSGAQGRHKHLWQLRPEHRELWSHLNGKKRLKKKSKTP